MMSYRHINHVTLLLTDCYVCFLDYHGGFKKTDKHPAKDFGDVSVFGDLDPTGEFVVSTRVRCGRSMEGYPFNPW
jgi:hypothetical protein